MSIMEKWMKRFKDSLNDKERDALKLYLDLKGEITEELGSETLSFIVKALTKMRDARLETLELELEDLKKRVDDLEQKRRRKRPTV